MATEMTKERKPSKLTILSCKCPRCRLGAMFLEKNPYKLKTFMKMYERCPVCGQDYDLEVGFYYGSSYVSYGLTVALSGVTFAIWWFTLGFSLYDNSVFYWLGINAFLLVALQPVLMRVSRAMWLSFFVSYDRNWRTNPVKTPERTNKDLKNAW